MRLQEWNSRFNGDGIYLAYDIMYENSVVGFVNYYYNLRNHSFSYRQSVICTFDLSKFGLPEETTNNLILNLEYSDIPIEKPESPEFKAGQFDEKTGGLEKDAVIDRFTLSDKHGKGAPIGNPVFSRAYITTRQTYEKGHYVTYSFIQPDTSIEYGATPWQNLGDEIMSVMKKYSGDDFLIGTSEERTRADINLIFDFLPLMYEQGSSIVEHNKEDKFVSNGYRSYDDYSADSFNSTLKDEGFTNHFTKEGSHNCYPRPVVFIYDAEKALGAASSKNVGSYDGGERFIDAVGFYSYNDSERKYDNSRYEESGFKAVYGEYSDDFGFKDMEDFIIRKHLESCGISPDESDYIDRFSEEYINWETKRKTYGEGELMKVVSASIS